MCKEKKKTIKEKNEHQFTKTHVHKKYKFFL